VGKLAENWGISRMSFCGMLLTSGVDSGVCNGDAIAALNWCSLGDLR
jgi:hypothetical protein